MGSILRGAGAVFMRRTFMSNSLYSTVFFEHIRALMTRGNSIEFFPEGGRSRTGLSLPPRPGLLSLIIRSFASLKDQNVKIVPVYIGYEKILEGLRVFFHNLYKQEQFLHFGLLKRQNF